MLGFPFAPESGSWARTSENYLIKGTVRSLNPNFAPATWMGAPLNAHIDREIAAVPYPSLGFCVRLQWMQPVSLSCLLMCLCGSEVTVISLPFLFCEHL